MAQPADLDDGVNVGQIRERHGAPFGSDGWEWFCGFYPGSHPGDQRMGTAETFDQARADFERAWELYEQKRTPADFRAWRHQHAWTEAKYAAWDRGEAPPPWPLPGFYEMDASDERQAEPRQVVSDRRYAEPAVAMTRILELANGAEADQGRISLGPINRTVLDEGASVEEYKAGLELAIAEGLLELHASRAYVMFTAEGAERFA